MRTEKTEPTGGWWIPPTCASLAVAAVTLSVDAGLLVDLVHPTRWRLQDWFVAFGAVCAGAIGMMSGGLATRRASFPAAVLAIVTPWISSLALAHVVVERFGQIEGAAPTDRSFEALALARPAIALHALGAATSAGLAVGVFLVFVLHHKSSNARAMSGPLLVTAVVAALTAARDVVVERSIVALCGPGILVSMDGLLAPASAEWVERLHLVEGAIRWTLVGGLAVGSLVLAMIVRRPSVRVSVANALAIITLLATPVVSYVVEARLADRTDRWAHPEWVRFDELEVPSLSDLAASMSAFDAPRVVEAAGIVWNDRWIPVGGVARSSSLAAHLRGTADVAELRALRRSDFESMRVEVDPNRRDRAILLAIDARVRGERWREIVDALREAEVDTLCIASRVGGDGVSTPSVLRRGQGWIDAFTPTPAEFACLDTEAVLPSSWSSDPELLELRLRDRPHVAVRARPGASPFGRPCDEPRPIAVLTFADEITTTSLSGLTFELLRCVRPILAWTPRSDVIFETTLEGHDRSTKKLDEAGAQAIVPLQRIHVPPVDGPDPRAIEVLASVEREPHEFLDRAVIPRTFEHVRVRGSSIARCFEAELAQHDELGVRLYVDMVTDSRGVPLDVACTRAARSDQSLCDCVESSLSDEEPDVTAPELASRTTVTIWSRSVGTDPTTAGD